MKIFKKIGALICVIGLASCSKSTMTWADVEKDMNKAIENGWEVYIENTEKAKKFREKESKAAFKKELNKDYEATLLTLYAYAYDNDKILTFEEYANANEPEYVYELYSSREGNWMKVYISGNIMITTNCKEGVELLGYAFK